MVKFKLLISSIRLIPHLLIIIFHSDKSALTTEYQQWLKILRVEYKGLIGFLFLLTFIKEFRNVYYLRIGKVKLVLNILARKSPLIFIDTPSSEIKSGLIFQHGFSSIVNAKSIGKNCQIWHNVTIGKSKSGFESKPCIGDNVSICAGAIVIGDIKIGNNVTIGAGSVVTKSVPDNCTVVGNPAKIIFQNGVKCNVKL